MDGISTFIKETPEISLPLVSTICGRKEKAASRPWTRKLLSPDTEWAGALIWDFLASETKRNKCLLFVKPGIFVIAAPMHLDSDPHKMPENLSFYTQRLENRPDIRGITVNRTSSHLAGGKASSEICRPVWCQRLWPKPTSHTHSVPMAGTHWGLPRSSTGLRAHWTFFYLVLI